MGMRSWWTNMKLSYKVGLGFLWVSLLVLVVLGGLWWFQEKEMERFRNKVEQATQALEEIQEIRSGHIRWKVNVLTHLLNEDLSGLKPDLTFEKLQKFRRLNSFEVSPSVWQTLESSAQEINQLIQKMKEAEDIDVAIDYYNSFQKVSKRFLWEGLEKMLAEYRNFVKKEKELLLEKKKLVRNVYIIFVGFLILFILGLSRFVGKRLERYMGQVLEAGHEIAKGNFRVALDLSRGDELGIMMRALDEIKHSMNEVVCETQKICQKLAPFVKEFRGLGEEVKNQSTEIEVTLSEVVKLSQGIFSRIEEQAHSLRELKEAIEEISQNVTQTSEISRLTMEKVRENQALIQEVDRSSKEVEEIIDLISHIAEQTKYLALNATIEAARAGEAGKGFTVVANEVKELARQTNEAAASITERIFRMREGIKKNVEASQEIVRTFQEVEERAVSIASAIEEQSALISQIGERSHQDQEDVQTMVDRIENVHRRFQEVERSIIQNVEFVNQLEGFVQDLLDLINRFRTFQTERRQYSRIRFHEKVSFSVGTKTYRGRLKDFGFGGIYIFSDYRPPKNTYLQAQLRINHTLIKVEGQVARVDSEGFGLKLTTIGEEDLQKLRRALEQYLPADRVEKELQRLLGNLYRSS